MSRHHQRAPSREWMRVRAAVLEAADFRCAECPATATEVHHRVPVSRGGKYFDVDNQVPLCAECHRKKHRRPRDPEMKKWDVYAREVLRGG